MRARKGSHGALGHAETPVWSTMDLVPHVVVALKHEKRGHTCLFVRDKITIPVVTRNLPRLGMPLMLLLAQKRLLHGQPPDFLCQCLFRDERGCHR